MNTCRIIELMLVCIVVTLNIHAQESSGTSGKKIVEYGWDVPTPAFIAEHIRDMEKRPFDGLLFRLKANGMVLEPTPINEADLAEDLEAVDKIRWEKFTDNFVMMYAASTQDWFNDDHWKAIEHNTELVTRVARRAGCVGVCFDAEPYGTNPWAYRDAPHRDTKTYADYKAIVRKRGEQFVRAIEREFPDATILTFFHASIYRKFCRPMPENVRKEELEKTTYALLPAFVEGMLQGSQTDIRIVDGNEGAYYYTNSLEYFNLYHAVTQRARYLIPPDVWPAYYAKVRMGQALYIDQYYGMRKTEKTLGNYMTPEEQAKWFEHNIYWALYTTDRYVWCYSERMNWWTDTGVPPGAEEAIRNARAAIEAGEPLSFDLAPIIETAEAKNKEDKKNTGK